MIIGIVQKASTLVQLVWTAAIDTTAQRVVFRRFFTFRGDNDEAWQRAERFVSEEVRDRLLEYAKCVCNGSFAPFSALRQVFPVYSQLRTHFTGICKLFRVAKTTV